MRVLHKPSRSSQSAWPPGRAIRALARQETGDTLIEVLVSAMLLVIIVLGALGGFDAAGKASVSQRQYSQADAVAQADEERLQSIPIATVLSTVGSPTTNTTSVVEGGTTFTVYHTAVYESDSTGNAPCSATGTSSADYLRTDSYATWVNANVTHTVDETSVISPPETATLVVHDTDDGPNPISGVAVTVKQGSTLYASGTTDANGCAIFTGLTDGTYTVGVSQAGDIDQSQSQAPTKSATVVTGESTAVTFTYAPAAYVTANFISAVLSTLPATLGQPVGTTTAATTGDSFTVYNSQVVPGGTVYSFGSSTPSTPPTSTSIPTASPGLFAFNYVPLPHGVAYSAYAGACASDDPAKVSGGAITDDSVVLTPGLATTTSVYEPPVEIRIFDINGNALTTAPTDIHVTDTGTGCGNDTRVYTSGNGGLVSNPTTSATGALADPDLPFGTYTVCVDLAGKSVSKTGLSNSTLNGLTPPGNAVTINFQTMSPSSSRCSP